MPPVSALNIQGYRGDPGDRRATHEDYTIAILEHGSLGRAIRASFPCDPRHVAALISHDVRVVDDFFRDGGFDHRRILSQIISSELDADLARCGLGRWRGPFGGSRPTSRPRHFRSE
jgi:HD superfamily phosphohydrolase